MDPKYKPQQIEAKIYKEWEDKNLFKAVVDKSKKPFSIILPPPNANASLHLGHAMYVYEDVMIRYHRLIGDETLWLPGADHAGIETQYVFEKFLQKQGKSRFDYDRETLFKKIWDFVMENRGTMEDQLRRLGFSLDWEKKKFTLDDDIVKVVYRTFKKLADKNLLYRDYKLVNYCTRCGTSFSDLEVVYVEREDSLYYMKYGPFTIATVRPETKFRDTALAVNPKDKRYKKYIGEVIEVQGLLGPIRMTVIPDPEVDPKFGTGIMKVTPAHDPHDFELGKKFDLPVTPIITTSGKMDFSWFLNRKDISEKYRQRAKKYHNQKVAVARSMIVEDLKTDGLLIKVDQNYTHRVGTCYRDGRVIEPLPLEQWFIKVKPLVDKAKKLVVDGEIKIHPKRFKKRLIDILDNFIDWNISRQIVWGIRIPAYRCRSTKKWFIETAAPKYCAICGKDDFIQDEDTFDTWFSSAQWPFAVLATQKSNNIKTTDYNNELFNYYYPTTVMETGYDILRAWVSRMIMIGYFATGKPPFKNIFLHGLVRDRFGQKMSKSKGNVINPMAIVDRYGADVLRAALVFGVKEGGDLPFTEDKLIGMRNFCNKVWNIGRFIDMNRGQKTKAKGRKLEILKELGKEFKEEKKKYLKSMDGYKFSQAFGLVYEFVWHRFADYYLEQLKDDVINGNIKALETLEEVFLENLKMLHPFVPFVTEAIYKVFGKDGRSILQDRL